MKRKLHIAELDNMVAHHRILAFKPSAVEGWERYSLNCKLHQQQRLAQCLSKWHNVIKNFLVIVSAFMTYVIAFKCVAWISYLILQGDLESSLICHLQITDLENSDPLHKASTSRHTLSYLKLYRCRDRKGCQN